MRKRRRLIQVCMFNTRFHCSNHGFSNVMEDRRLIARPRAIIETHVLVLSGNPVSMQSRCFVGAQNRCKATWVCSVCVCVCWPCISHLSESSSPHEGRKGRGYISTLSCINISETGFKWLRNDSLTVLLDTTLRQVGGATQHQRSFVQSKSD